MRKLYKIGRVCLQFHTISFRLFARYSLIFIIFEGNIAKLLMHNILTFVFIYFMIYLLLSLVHLNSANKKQTRVKSTTNFLPSMPT
jgi:hypothetical protein